MTRTRRALRRLVVGGARTTASIALASALVRAAPAVADPLAVPRDDFVIVARIAANTRAASGDARVYAAEGWVRDGRNEIGALGTISAARATALARRLIAPVTVVVARYAVDAAELAVDIYRLERGTNDDVAVWRASFAPRHGNRWAAAGRYLSPGEASTPGRVGRNPFARFDAGVGDNLFHGIDLAAAQTAIGHAMTYYRAQFGILGVVQLHIDTTQTHSGGFFHRTYRTIEHVIARTTWRVATPAAVQPWASIPTYCVVDLVCQDSACRSRSCPDPALVASAGAAFDDWTGPTLALSDQEIASLASSSSGWTVLGVGALTDLLAPGNGLPEIGTTLATRGGSALQPQSAPLGATGNGTAVPTLSPGSAIEKLAGPPLQRGVFGPEGQRFAGLQSGYAATVSDPKSFERDRAAAATRDAVAQYQRCRQRGYEGEVLRRCAASLTVVDPSFTTPR